MRYRLAIAGAAPSLPSPFGRAETERFGWTMPEATVDERLEALLDEYGHVLRWAIRRVASGTSGIDLDDVEQDARLRVWRALSRKQTFGQPQAYLYRVAVTATLDALRRVKARREEPLATPDNEDAPLPATARDGDSPEGAALRGEQMARVREALARLATNRRSAVKLYLQGFNSAEIGRLRGWTEPKARNLVYRGLGDLRALLGEEASDALD